MKILALDLSKYKTVACDYEAETGRHQFATVLTQVASTNDERWQWRKVKTKNDRRDG